MKKFLTYATAAMAATMLSASLAYAAPTLSPTEPDRPPTGIEDSDVPLGEKSDGSEEPGASPAEKSEGSEAPAAPLTGIEDLGVPLADQLVEIEDLSVPLADKLVEIADLSVPLVTIDDPDVPLADILAPQTGVSGLTGMEALALAAFASTTGGAAILAKAGKQKGSVC